MERKIFRMTLKNQELRCMFPHYEKSLRTAEKITTKRRQADLSSLRGIFVPSRCWILCMLSVLQPCFCFERWNGRFPAAAGGWTLVSDKYAAVSENRRVWTAQFSMAVIFSAGLFLITVRSFAKKRKTSLLWSIIQKSSDLFAGSFLQLHTERILCSGCRFMNAV